MQTKSNDNSIIEEPNEYDISHFDREFCIIMGHILHTVELNNEATT